MQRSTRFSPQPFFGKGLVFGGIITLLCACGSGKSATTVSAQSIVVATAVPTSTPPTAAVVEATPPAVTDQSTVEAALAASQAQTYVHFTGTLSRDLKLFQFEAHYAAPNRFHLRMGDTEFAQVGGVFYVPVGEQWVEAPEWRIPEMQALVDDLLSPTATIVNAQLSGPMVIDGVATQVYEYGNRISAEQERLQQVKVWVRQSDNLPIKRELRYEADGAKVFAMQAIAYEPQRVADALSAALDTPIAQGRMAGAWREFSSTEGKFTLLLPGLPQAELQTVDAAVGPIDFHRFVVHLSNGTYLAAYADYPAEVMADHDPAELLKNIQDSIVAKGNGTLLTEESYIVAEHPGRAARILAQDGLQLIRMRLIFVGNRLYQVLALGTVDNMTHSTTDHFLDSFQPLTP